MQKVEHLPRRYQRAEKMFLYEDVVDTSRGQSPLTSLRNLEKILVELKDRGSIETTWKTVLLRSYVLV